MTDDLPQYDFSDPMISTMVERNHAPYEIWSSRGVFMGVFCDYCHNNWPCPARAALVDYRVNVDEVSWDGEWG